MSQAVYGGVRSDGALADFLEKLANRVGVHGCDWDEDLG
jgi:hypothetical protein